METASEVKLHVRWMIKADLASVLGIESKSFDRPWCEEDFCDRLRFRNAIGMVVDRNGTVCGYMIYMLDRGKIVVEKLAVHPDFRRQNVGKKMVDKLKSKLNENRRRKLELLVRETSVGAQLFFKEMGFRAIEVIRGHFEDEGVDAYLMCHELADTFSAAPDGEMPRNRIRIYL
ncbi:MAG: GNAT family N-acetyltransferase [Candidatus Pacebacteria bacterium]|nr:GNAT family N-acetyltransferase [Candidatus Paceibacterota bacterium]